MTPNFNILNRAEKHFASVMLYAPGMLGNDAVNFFLDRFKDQAWLGASREPWRARKTNTKWGPTKRNKGRALLIDTGYLRRSIRITSVHAMQVTIGTDAPYAKAHNEGYRMGQIQNVKGYWRKKNINKQVAVGKGKTQKFKTKRVYDKMVWVGQHTRRVDQRIPRRQFMGDSPYLTNLLIRRLTAELMKGVRV